MNMEKLREWIKSLNPTDEEFQHKCNCANSFLQLEALAKQAIINSGHMNLSLLNALLN